MISSWSTQYIHLQRVKLFQELLCNTNNSIFAHRQLQVFQFNTNNSNHLHTEMNSNTWNHLTNNSIKHQSFVYTQSNIQIVLFLTIQFNMSFVWMSNISIWPIDGTLSGATTQGQNSWAGASPSDGLMSNPGHSLEERSYLSAEMQSIYSMAPAKLAGINFNYIYIYIYIYIWKQPPKTIEKTQQTQMPEN